MNGLRILAAYRDNAANYYRVQCPFNVLRLRGYDVEIRQPAIEDAKDFDVLWLQMHSDPMSDILIREFKDAGKKIVYDMDDWVFEVPPSWDSYPHYFVPGRGTPNDRIHFITSALRNADLVTCTTPYFAEKLREKTERPIAVLPNCVLMGDWDTLLESRHEQDGPVVGWFGTANHWDDWREIAVEVDRAIEKTKGYLALVGAPEMLVGFPESLRKRTMVVSLHPMRLFDKLRPMIAACDVGIAWATESLEISKCRSPLKAFQWGAAGVPVVASKEVYGEVVKEGFGITTPNPGGVGICIEELLLNRSEAQRKQMSNVWRERVFERHSYETQSMRWIEALENIL